VGFDVCPTVTPTHSKNADRVANGHPVNQHFRAYKPDLQTVRRCCVGEARECSKCHNAYARHTWIMINNDRHTHSVAAFIDWLSSVATFYVTMRGVGGLFQDRCFWPDTPG
jgi:hypothetical protein